MKRLCQFHTGCFGCCGFLSKEKTLEKIQNSTNTLQQYNLNGKTKEEFMRRHDLKESKMCANIGYIKYNKVGCIVYPKDTNTDIRKSYCEWDILCKTQKEFNKWVKTEQEDFLDFIKETNPNLYDYSVEMVNGELLRKYKKKLY